MSKITRDIGEALFQNNWLPALARELHMPDTRIANIVAGVEEMPDAMRTNLRRACADRIATLKELIRKLDSSRPSALL